MGNEIGVNSFQELLNQFQRQREKQIEICKQCNLMMTRCNFKFCPDGENEIKQDTN